MQDCDICGKYFIKSTVLKMHKFCRSGATKFDMFTNAGIVKHVETIFLKPLSWRCITSVIVGRSQCCKEKAFLWETNTKINFPGKPTHEIKSLTNMGFVISAENIFSQPLCWRCINLDTAGRSHFYKENWEFCKKIFPKHTSQVSHMFTHTGEKPYRYAGLWYLWKIFHKIQCPEDEQIFP